MNEETNEKKEPAAIVRHGAAAVRIYEVKADTTATGVAYKFQIPGQRSVTRAKLDVAKLEAKKALQLVTQGAADATTVTVADLSELEAVRRLAKEGGFPTVAAMQEWLAAKALTGAALLSVAKEHAAAIADGKHERVTHAEAWKRFIVAKSRFGGKGVRTYTSKAGMIQRGLGADIMLDTLTDQKIRTWVGTIADAVTHDDLLKRLTTMLRWSRKNGLWPRSRAIPTDDVDRINPKGKEPGIVTPRQLKACLEWVRKNHQQYLAALALAALAGERSDEIHGKRSDKGVPRESMPRQRWDHIYPSDTPDADGMRGWFRVSVAKNNTPANRTPPIQPALLAWLKLCPRDGDYVCIAGAMERVRELLRSAPASADLGLPREKVGDLEFWVLPPNSFRHAFISHRLPLAGIVKTAEEAGNSPTEIEKSYRVPMPKELAKPYWEIMPD